MRRMSIVVIAISMISLASLASALTVRDVIELTKAGVSDQVLLALIEVDHRVYTIDADAVKSLKAAGVSDTVLLAMINAGRTAPDPGAAAAPAPPVAMDGMAPAPAPQPQVVVIDHSASQPPVQVPVAVPIAVPVAVPISAFRQERVSTIVTTDTGAAVRVRVPVPPNCTKAEPIYWGNGGKRRAGTWAPPTQIVCR